MADQPLAVVSVVQRQHYYRAAAYKRHVSIERQGSDQVEYFSTVDGAEYCALARAAFDGVQWDLPTLTELVEIYERKTGGRHDGS